ncbi:hypothetical protein MnTg03_00187 [bacterium MnTg03]|nr:hypothetical protein MnTg03_00187 [bacterium MnTg03]
MNLRAIYHLTGKFSTDYIGILFDQGSVTYSLIPDMAPGRMIMFPSYLMH